MPDRPSEVSKSAASLRDLLGFADHFAGVSMALSDRFFTAAEATFERLARRPGIGAPWHDRDVRVAGVRCAGIDGFKNHLVLYREIDDGIRVLRVMHAARDLKGLTFLVEEEGGDAPPPEH